MSTDSINFQPIQTSNLTEFNDLNTITEYVTEVVLGYKNFFPESASPDHHKQNQAQKHITIKLYNPSTHCIDMDPFYCFAGFQFPSNENATFRFSPEINPPPNLSAVFIS